MNTLSFKDHFAVVYDLHPKVIDFVLPTLIFIMQANKGDVPIPHVPDAERGSINQLLHWSESVQDPHPDETSVQAMASLQRDEPGMNDKRDRQNDPDRLFGFDNDSAHPLYRLLLLVDSDLSQQIEVTQHLPGAQNHARQRIFRQGHG